MATGLHDRKLCGNLYRSDLVQRIHQLDYLCGHEYGSAVPKELDETAYLDGYSFWRFFLKIFLPTIAAGIGVVAFFCFMYSWVELLFAKTLTSVAAKPIVATMTRTASTAGYELGLLAAAGTLTIIPGAYPASGDWVRPPHIHYKVRAPSGRSITTQMYFAGDPLNDKDLLLARLSADERGLVEVAFDTKTADGRRRGTFNLVLGTG